MHPAPTPDPADRRSPTDAPPSVLRWWGASMTATWWIIALLVQWRTGATVVASAIAVAAIALAAVYYGNPKTQRPIYRGFMTVTWPIRALLSLLLLALVYYAVVTPIGLGLRLLGYDPLDLRRSDQRDSYWRPRPSPPPAESYFRQY